MLQSNTYKRSLPCAIALCVVLVVLALFNGGFIMWDVARTITYQYVRDHRSELKFQDTVVLSAEAMQGGKELTWIEHDEIRYHGEMYDIKQQIALEDGRVMLVGHYDDWDNELFNSLEKLLEPTGGQKPTGGQQRPKEETGFFWIAEAVIPACYQHSYCYANTALQHFSNCGQHTHPTHTPDVPCPPPDVRFV